jgi:hypothetical protein
MSTKTETVKQQTVLARKHGVAALVASGMSEKTAGDKYDRYMELRARNANTLTARQAAQVDDTMARIRKSLGKAG